MKIVKEDQSLMVLKDSNIVAYLVGIMFFALGLVVIFNPDFFDKQPPLWSGLLGAVFGGYVIAMAKMTTIRLDKLNKRLVFLRKGLIGQTSKEYDLSQIKEIELSVSYSSSRRGGGHSYHLAFVLSNGESVALNPGSSSIVRVMGRQLIPEKDLGARVAAFLGVPFLERRPPTVTESLSALSTAIQNAAEKKMEK